VNLILTHDNADFDAVAAQLAAHKLMPDATPITSRRLHRNVRHFLTLYYEALPFVASEDLTRAPVQKAILVDTQTLPTVRGIGKKTAVQIIDHHTPHREFQPDWDVLLDPVGAATTLLIEQLQEQTLRLTPIEATLMLLGIYEDTGSLTYGTTTARDAHAAAWLLEQNASLDIVREFLNHPLTADQQALYDRLIETAEGHEIAGYHVIIATAEAPDIVEEIATVAHRLRNMLEPAALFMLVKLKSHIQLVARSTTDAINVGEIARKLGGGGHSRAAAAIVKSASLGEARQNMLALLPDQIAPGLTVADLMSHGVKTLPSSTPAREAEARMRRYGYEGFPVVDRGKLVGLLARREIDRAMSHGLDNVPISQLMTPGSVTIQSGETIHALQQVMMRSGWGQIPVADESGKLLGVVTRTDLIKHMGQTSRPLSRQAEIIQRLEQSLHPLLYAIAIEAGRAAQSLGSKVHIVGGVVRDLLLGYPITDFDFVVEGNAIALTQVLHDRFGGAMRSHKRFGTSKWLLDGSDWESIAQHLNIPASSRDSLPAHIDFVTARTEFYHAPTALPQIEPSSIKHDLHRRDFTINTLAIRLDPPATGSLLDYYGGESDLREGRIRALHSLSFVDDPTRILRAVRLEQRFNFQIEERTAELLRQAVPLLERVSGDRIRHEIELILDEERPEKSFHRLDDLGILSTLHPDLHSNSTLEQEFTALRGLLAAPAWPELSSLDSELSYFALLTLPLKWEKTLVLCDRLRVQRHTLSMLETTHSLAAGLESLEHAERGSQIAQVLEPADDDVLATLWAAASPVARSAIETYAVRLRHIHPHTDGTALRLMGLRPGPQFGRILRGLRMAWLDGAVTDQDQEQALLAKLISEDT
jgi:tRNA nucleotidyltransferase (CCA-adding enzyme)